jgi:TonB-dependent SusC/RagA subfamily outer membrane receptor
MKRIGIFSAAALLLTSPLAAQTTLLVGRVVDSATAKPVRAGWITVLGTSLAAPLREDGSFALSVPVRQITASIRADGYKVREFEITPSEDLLEIRLPRDYFEEEGKVASGQATSVDRRNAPNAVASVGAGDIEKTSSQDMKQALSGKVTGATVGQSSAPGQQMFLRLRGMSTLLGNDQPLYIIDGITVAGIDALNPNDIEDVQILKGASAGAMYGSKASNGVVIIKTKRGGLSNAKK